MDGGTNFGKCFMYSIGRRMIRFERYWTFAALLFLLAPVIEAEEAPLKVLKELSLDTREISRVLKGDIVTKKLETRDKRDIAVIGAMMLSVPPEATLDAVRDIKTFKEGKEILGLGKFDKFDGDEIKTLTLEEAELEDLGECKVKDCESKMPATWIEKLHGEADPQKRLELLRDLLRNYAQDYSARGNEAVLDYENTEHPISAEKEFEGILNESPYLHALAPDFQKYLKQYPKNPPAGTENFIYWSREKFGFKPVINLTHVSIYKWVASQLSGYMIASRQVYADHYCDASLGLTILIDIPERNGKPQGSYLIYINRSRIDMLAGFLSSLRRAITLSRIKSGLETHMKTMKTRVEDKTQAKGR
jgi:hypothetical protein